MGLLGESMAYYSTKTYGHNIGLSAVFRQPHADHSHCRFLHGYSLGFKFTFACSSLDNKNWAVDFGGLKPLKQWLEDTFDHKVVFDVEGKDGPPVDLANVLMKGTLIKAVLKCNGIWVANGKFGCTWRAEQIRAKVPEGGLREFAIESDSDDEAIESDSNDEIENNNINIAEENANKRKFDTESS